MNTLGLSDLRKRLDSFESEIQSMIAELQDIATRINPLRDSVSKAEYGLMGLLSGNVATTQHLPPTPQQQKNNNTQNINWTKTTLSLLKDLKKANYDKLVKEYIKRNLISSNDENARNSIRQSIYTT